MVDPLDDVVISLFRWKCLRRTSLSTRSTHARKLGAFLKRLNLSKIKQVETQTSTFTIRADTSPLLEALSTLRDFLHAGKFPLQLFDGVLNLLDTPGKLSRITSITTAGTGITIRFEPADILFALVTALRTGNLDSFFLEHGDLAFRRSITDT